MATPTTYNTETELSSVNSILGSIGQSPVTRLYNEQNGELVFINPEISFVYQILQECNIDVQNEGWVFNTEDKYPLIPDENNEIKIPDNMLRMDVSEGQVYRTTDVVKRQGKLYDKLSHSYEFTNPLEFDIVWKFDYEDLPSVFKRYITHMASRRAATQLVANPQLVQLLGTNEGTSRAACMEYECNQGDNSFFGTPSNTAYRAYQPYRTLAR